MRVIDSHTGGQPTRVIIEGGPNLGLGTIPEQKVVLEEQFDHIRKQTVLEPKCSDAMVGALLCEPSQEGCTAGVIFFNTSGYLGMCGHGLIGFMVTLAYLGRIEPGVHLIETPVGVVKATLKNPNEVEFENVESYCLHHDVIINVPSVGDVTGQVAWGGNWFFLVNEAPCELALENTEALTQIGRQVRGALVKHKVTGEDGAEIDHIEFFQTPKTGPVNSKSFVLCPGGAYDRSPCGTGTSAKVACLAKSGLLQPGEVWVQESFIGSQFQATYQHSGNGRVIPTICGNAYVYGDTQLVSQKGDPYINGIG